MRTVPRKILPDEKKAIGMHYEDMLMPEHTHYTEDNTMHTENGRGAKECADAGAYDFHGLSDFQENCLCCVLG